MAEGNMDMEKAPEGMEELYRAIAQLKTPEECQRFLSKFCTFSELRSMEQRAEMAVFLEQGKEYLSILEQSGAHNEVVNAVRTAMLEHGSGGMIEEIIHRE